MELLLLLDKWPLSELSWPAWPAAEPGAEVQADCALNIETNSYSVWWRLIGKMVQVTLYAG